MADESDWQYHTDEILIRKLFFWKEDSIRKGIVYLQAKGFIDTNAPNYLKTLYKSGRTKWFRVLIPSVQQWIIDNYPLIEIEAEEIVTMAPMDRKYKKANEFTAQAKRLYRFRELLLNEPESIATKTELNKITARLKEGKDEIDLAIAVIGNLENPWHRGENPNSTDDKKITYHLVRHIFKDKEQVVMFTQVAESNGWTRTRVIDKYESVLNINYENRTSVEVKESNQTEVDKIREDQLYRETASLLTELVINQKLKMDEILIQFYNRSEKLGFTIIDLNNPERLGREIVDCLAQNEIVPVDRKDRIMLFANNFILKLKRGING